MASGSAAFRAASALLLGLLSAGPTVAADRVILGTRILVRDPGASEDTRRVQIVGRETATDVPAISDPTAGGATLTVIANGATDSAVAFALDPGGWSALGTTGFRYVGPTGADEDPVRRLVIKRTPGGVALVKLLLRGNVGTQPLAVVPPSPGDEGGLVLDVAGGDRYCVKLGGAAGGTEQQDTASSWKIVGATAEDGCPTPPSTTSTSSTTSTTATLPPGCGNNQLDPGEQCDGTSGIPECDPLYSMQCIAPGQPAECQCCGVGYCLQTFPPFIDCCEGSVCVDVPGFVDVCVFCGAGTTCFDAGTGFGQVCCAGSICTRPLPPPGLVVKCCLPAGEPCATGSQCCSDSCNAGGTCDCSPPGHPCIHLFGNDCCSGSCDNGTRTCN